MSERRACWTHGIYSSLAYWADSTGRRNVALMSRVYKLIEGFGRGSPAESFAGSAVEGDRDRGEVVAVVSDKVGALREVLA